MFILFVCGIYMQQVIEPLLSATTIFSSSCLFNCNFTLALIIKKTCSHFIKQHSMVSYLWLTYVANWLKEHNMHSKWLTIFLLLVVDTVRVNCGRTKERTTADDKEISSKKINICLLLSNKSIQIGCPRFHVHFIRAIHLKGKRTEWNVK